MKNKKISSSWIIIPILVILLIGIGIYTNLRQHISGTYSHSTDILIAKIKSNYTFKGENFTGNDGTKGSYKINGNTIELKEKNGKKIDKIKGKLSNDRKSFKLMGMKYTKDEK